MQSENIELIRQMYDLGTKNALPELLSLIDPDILIRQSELLPWGGEFHGVEGFTQFMGLLRGHVHSEVEIDEWIEAGNQVVGIGYTVGHVKKTGNEFRIRIAHLWTVEDGRATRFEPYIDTPGMLEAFEN